MPKLTIDGKEITVDEGTTVFEAARQVETTIPHFCYHPKLSIAGNCRMCLVEIEKMPKPQISCNTVVQEGMVVHTQTENVKALQKNVLEFILINHPIDCPVCDQAGECKLQGYYMDHSASGSEFNEAKVKKPKRVDLGPNVMLDDERCILCTRCVRFCDEISQTGELCVTNRGDRSTLRTFPGKKLENKYSLNTVDICPVGALTSKPFRFQQRVWFLKSVPSICTGCATGCNIYVDHNDGKVFRYKTRENEEVNQCWTCDEGRLSYTFINEARLIRPLLKTENGIEEINKKQAVLTIVEKLKSEAADNMVFIGSAYESNENNAALKKLADALGVKRLEYAYHEVENPSSDDFLIKADKNPNRAGVKKLSYAEFSGELSGKTVIAMEKIGTSQLEKIRLKKPQYLILLSSQRSPACELADVILPVSTFAEQKGSFINFQNRIQKFESALEVKGEMQSAWQYLQEIAEGLGHAWNIVSSDKLLQEFFNLNYEAIGEQGKVIEN
ncbi:MAG: (2Fe-2S)-binding protein [Deltaproteobacteria bacterium]|nr:(2Fe-2S)-binding protein [Deltaproteobacteria bacterium]